MTIHRYLQVLGETLLRRRSIRPRCVADTLKIKVPAAATAGAMFPPPAVVLMRDS